MGRKVPLLAAAMIALVGAVLVFVYARGADSRAEQRFDTVDVLVASETIEAGEPLDDAFATGKVDLQAVAQGQVLPGASNDGAAFEGLTALTTIYAGEQLVPDKTGGASDVKTASTLPIPKGKMAISVNLTDPSRVAGFVDPGSEVAVFFTGTAETLAGGALDVDVTKLLLPRVTVLGVGSTTQVTTTKTEEDGSQTTEQLPATLITLALSQAEAEQVFLADKDAELSLGLLTESSQIKKARALSEPELFE